MYQKAVDCRFYRLIHKSQRYDHDVTSETQKMHDKVTVQKKDQPFNSEDSISVTNLSTEYKRA